jgi:hypothetical protein
MEAPELSWRPLGQLFVDKGLLTELRLEHALKEQAATGGPLGEKLVALGYVTSTALARLLAEQYGVELTLDTGFGTGLRAELERRLDNDDADDLVDDYHEPAAAAASPTLTLVEKTPQRRRTDGVHSPLAALEEQWAKLAAADARISELEQQIVRLNGQIRERDDRIAELSARAAAKPRRNAKPKPS